MGCNVGGVQWVFIDEARCLFKIDGRPWGVMVCEGGLVELQMPHVSENQALECIQNPPHLPQLARHLSLDLFNVVRQV